MERSPQQRAALRCCASCEWIYKGAGRPCPQCGFVSYGARFIHGNKAYKYAITQQPWLDRKMEAYAIELDQLIRAALAAKVAGRSIGMSLNVPEEDWEVPGYVPPKELAPTCSQPDDSFQ